MTRRPRAKASRKSAVAAGGALRASCSRNRAIYSLSARPLSASTFRVTASPTAAARVAGHSTLKRRPCASMASERRDPRNTPSSTRPVQTSCPSRGLVRLAEGDILGPDHDQHRVARPMSLPGPAVALRAGALDREHVVVAREPARGDRGRDEIGRAEEGGDAAAARPLVDLFRRADLQGAALAITTTRSDSAIASSWSCVT